MRTGEVYLLASVALLTVALLGCPTNGTQPAIAPTAAFRSDVLSGAAPLTVSFTDLSMPGSAAITSWAWDFGDGLKHTEPNPTHTYAEPGLYTVSLTVTGASGTDTVVQTDVIGVTALPVTTYLLQMDGGGLDAGATVVPVVDGGAAVGGWTDATTNGLRGMLLERVDPYGKVLWRRTYPGLGEAFCLDMSPAPGGGYLLAGTTAGGGSARAMALRVSPQGVVQWEKTYWVGEESQFNAVTRAPDGGYILAGQARSGDDVDVMLMRITEEGAEVWREVRHLSSYDDVQDVVMLPGGRIAMVGWRQTASRVYGTVTCCGAHGSRLWSKDIGVSGEEVLGSGAAFTADGGLVVTTRHFGDTAVARATRFTCEGDVVWELSLGETVNEADVIATGDGGLLFSVPGAHEIALVKTDGAGAVAWTAELPVSGFYGQHPLAEMSGGGYAVVGTIIPGGLAPWDVVLARTDDAGHIDGI